MSRRALVVRSEALWRGSLARPCDSKGDGVFVVWRRTVDVPLHCSGHLLYVAALCAAADACYHLRMFWAASPGVLWNACGTSGSIYGRGCGW